MSYLCRRVLLKNAQEETGGFVRLESAAEGCAVDARANGMPADARLLLLRRDGGSREAGALRGGALQITLRGEDPAAIVGAAVAASGRALLFGGEGDVSAAARRAAAQAFAPKAVSARTEACRVPARETAAPVRAETIAAAARPTGETQTVARREAIPPEVLVPAQEQAEQAEAAAAPAQAEIPADGWTFRSAGDGLRFDATLYEDGTAMLTAHAVAADTPLPPAGMQGATKLNGFWMETGKPSAQSAEKNRDAGD